MEDEKGNLKSTIENEKRAQDASLAQLKMELDEQRRMIMD